MAKRSERDYAAMSRAVEDGDYTIAGRPIELGATLRMGRPIKDSESAGKTRGSTVRLPDPIRIELRHRVKDRHEADSESELIRRALVEYFENHPTRRR